MNAPKTREDTPRIDFYELGYIVVYPEVLERLLGAKFGNMMHGALDEVSVECFVGWWERTRKG